MEEVTRFASYQEYKAAFDAETERVKVGFVRIGYLLRIAEDTDILEESGYSTMEEFAWKEYHIDASQASRFKNINKRFSEGGYSDRLQEKFQGYGVAKLGELLTLPDEIIETLPPELTRSEIQEVKKEVAEEGKITDLEVMMEEPEGEGNNLEKWLDVYFRDNPEEFLKIKSIYLYPDRAQAVMEILAPSGIAAKTARIKGAGKFLLSVKGKDLPIELLNIRTNEKETYPMEDCFQAMKRICPYTTDPKKVYEARYQQPFPEKEEIAPVQPEKEHVQEALTEESELSPMAEGPRQAEIEDYPEVLPEGYIKCHDGSEVKESPWEEAERLVSEMYPIFAQKERNSLKRATEIITRITEIVKKLQEES